MNKWMCSAVAPHFLFHMHHAPTSQMSCIRIYTLYNELAASTATAVDLRIYWTMGSFVRSKWMCLYVVWFQRGKIISRFYAILWFAVSIIDEQTHTIELSCVLFAFTTKLIRYFFIHLWFIWFFLFPICYCFVWFCVCCCCCCACWTYSSVCYVMEI